LSRSHSYRSYVAAIRPTRIHAASDVLLKASQLNLGARACGYAVFGVTAESLDELNYDVSVTSLDIGLRHGGHDQRGDGQGCLWLGC
jgi:hypothetical protein